MLVLASGVVRGAEYGEEDVKSKSVGKAKVEDAREALSSLERDAMDERVKTFAEAGK